MNMTTATVAPFRALRYNPKKIADLSKVVAPPYDVIDERFRDALYDRDPNNVIRLILTKEEGPGLTKYQVARRYLHDWIQKEILIREASPKIYLYHQTYRLEDGRELTRKGFIARRRLESFEEGRVRPHEHTFAGPKADRLSLIKETETNLSPIFGIFPDRDLKVSSALNSLKLDDPLIDIRTEDGRHRVWGVDDPDLFRHLDRDFEQKTVFIADGHHRYETALAYRNFRLSQKKGSTGDEPFQYVMMYLCPMEDPGLVILPTHRVVTVPPSRSFSEVKKNLRDFFEVEEFDGKDRSKALEALRAKSQNAHAFLVAGQSGALVLLSASSDRIAKIPQLKSLPPAVRDLDVVILHQYLLPIAFELQVAESHDSEKIQYVKEAAEAFRRVEEKKAFLSFILNPTKIGQVEAISEIGERMPHKSTFFYPKLLSGLVFHPLND
jgi:uncharacterized protein (DUF1015 family)